MPGDKDKSWSEGEESLIMKQAGANIEEFIQREGRGECDKL